jgi:formate dehydrogenase (coenzyme F420) alpha subunit
MYDVNHTKMHRTLCGMCSITCPIEFELRDKEIDSVRIPEGHFLKSLCPKIQGINAYQYSDERIVVPKQKVKGGWKNISWSEALSTISEKLLTIKEKYGPEALVVHLGNPHVFQQTELLAHRFCDVYGTPNYTSGASYCHFARVIGNGLTFGYNGKYGVFAYPSYRGTKCMLLWGTNPSASAEPLYGVIPLLKKRGAKLIVIDPRRTALAKEADIHVQPRPGTDCALALGLINVIVAEGLYDKRFVENYTVGFERLMDHIKAYTPEEVEKITWVPADTIRDVARMYANFKPAALSQGVSLDHCTNGVQASRSTAILMAITGNINVAGGNVYYPSFPGDMLRVPERVTGRPYCDYPIFEKIVGETQNAPLAESILSGKPYPIKALVVQGANPMLTAPNTNNLKKAYEKLDLLVVIDHFMTDTAMLADIILPPTTFLERTDFLQAQGRPAITMRNKVFNPPQDCREDAIIWVDLAKKMGYGEYFPWESAEEIIESILKPAGIAIEQIREPVSGYQFAESDLRKFAFETPSGKVEIYSKTMEDHGYLPLPRYEEPAESPASRPDIAIKYPLVLTVGAHVGYFTHSRFRNVPVLRRSSPYPVAEINTKTALERDISNGDGVIVESLRGSIKLRASVTDDILPGVISLLHGWTEANANLLTDDGQRDPVSGYPAFRSLLCDVRKA